MTSKGLYIHIPFCLVKCGYCSFFSIECQNKDKNSQEFIPDEYINAVLNEVLFYKRLYKIGSWSTVYIGGGTPSLMSSFQIEKLCSSLLKDQPQNVKEFTIEVNPESVSKEKLFAAANSGVTRLSMGIQSLNQNALNAAGRHCGAKKAEEALDIVKKEWKGELSLDAIAGLPSESKQEFEDSLRRILNFAPDHISLYSLMIEENTPLEDSVLKKEIAYDEDFSDSLWIFGRDILEKEGFEQYEISNFARNKKIGIHNSSYWKQEDYIGCGSGATGTVYNFAGGFTRGIRWTNTKNIKTYIDFWNGAEGKELLESDFKNQEEDFYEFLEKKIPADFEFLNARTLEFEYLMMSLRTTEGADSGEYKKRFSSVEPWSGSLESRLKENSVWNDFFKKGMAGLHANSEGNLLYSLKKEGLLFLNSVLVGF